MKKKTEWFSWSRKPSNSSRSRESSYLYVSVWITYLQELIYTVMSFLTDLWLWSCLVAQLDPCQCLLSNSSYKEKSLLSLLVKASSQPPSPLIEPFFRVEHGTFEIEFFSLVGSRRNFNNNVLGIYLLCTMEIKANFNSHQNHLCV